MTTPLLELDELAAAQSQPHVIINRDLRALEVALQLAVNDKDSGTPPGSPVDGDRYIVGPGATGAWAGRENQVAYYSSGWRFLEPLTGWRAYVADENLWYIYGVGSPTGWREDAAQLTIASTGSPGDTVAGVRDITFIGAEVAQTGPNSATITVGTAGGGGSSGSTQTLAEAIAADTPHAYWKCNESAGTTLADSSGNGRSLTLSGTYTLGFSQLVPTETDAFVLFAAGTNGASRADGLGLSFPLTGDYTVEAVICPTEVSANLGRILTIVGAGETEAANQQVGLYLNVASGTTEAAQLGTAWEYGAGSNETLACGAANNAMGVRRGVAAHVAIVKNGTANTIDWYINGRRVFQTTYTNEISGGTGSLSTYIGSDGNANAGLILGHVALFTTALSATRIRAHARAAGFA